MLKRRLEEAQWRYETLNAGGLPFEFPERVRRGEVGLDQAVARLVS